MYWSRESGLASTAECVVFLIPLQNNRVLKPLTPDAATLAGSKGSCHKVQGVSRRKTVHIERLPSRLGTLREGW